LPGNKFPNGADLCKVLVPLSKATCIWEYHCAPATAQPVKPKKKTKATSSTDCSGDALTSLEIKTKLFNGYYDYTIKNSTHCFVCFTMNDCERTPDGSAECKTLAKRLGKKGSASGDEMGSNYRYEPIAKGIRFCK